MAKHWSPKPGTVNASGGSSPPASAKLSKRFVCILKIK